MFGHLHAQIEGPPIELWTQDLSNEYLASLSALIPRRIAAIIKKAVTFYSTCWSHHLSFFQEIYTFFKAGAFFVPKNHIFVLFLESSTCFSHEWITFEITDSTIKLILYIYTYHTLFMYWRCPLIKFTIFWLGIVHNFFGIFFKWYLENHNLHKSDILGAFNYLT